MRYIYLLKKPWRRKMLGTRIISGICWMMGSYLESHHHNRFRLKHSLHDLIQVE